MHNLWPFVLPLSNRICSNYAALKGINYYEAWIVLPRRWKELLSGAFFAFSVPLLRPIKQSYTLVWAQAITSPLISSHSNSGQWCKQRGQRLSHRAFVCASHSQNFLLLHKTVIEVYLQGTGFEDFLYFAVLLGQVLPSCEKVPKDDEFAICWNFIGTFKNFYK